MNSLYVGFEKEIKRSEGGYLYINDEVPDVPKARVFDPQKDCFNPLQDIDRKKAREIARLLYTASPQGENTLTVRNGRRALAAALVKSERFDKLKFDRDVTKEARQEVNGMIDDLLFTDVMRRVLCNRTNFSFNPRSVILARINRVELGDEDALVLGLLLMSHYKGQIVLPDGGFYLRDPHVSLIKEGRLIVGLNYLDELKRKAPDMRDAIMLIEDKVASGVTAGDAETLAEYRKLVPRTNKYNEFVHDAVA